MPIVPLRREHLPTVARLHREEIRLGLTPALGQRFAERLYWAIANSAWGFVLVLEQQQRVLGFVCGTVNTRRMYRDVLCRAALALGFGALGRLWRPSVVRAVVRALRRPKAFTEGEFAALDLPDAELVSLAVDPAARGQGVGARLTAALFERLRGAGCERVLVWTDEVNQDAVRFYQRCGFRCVATGRHHDAIRVLVADLSQRRPGKEPVNT